jgi:hypothetical protein
MGSLFAGSFIDERGMDKARPWLPNLLTNMDPEYGEQFDHLIRLSGEGVKERNHWLVGGVEELNGVRGVATQIEALMGDFS